MSEIGAHESEITTQATADNQNDLTPPTPQPKLNEDRISLAEQLAAAKTKVEFEDLMRAQAKQKKEEEEKRENALQDSISQQAMSRRKFTGSLAKLFAMGAGLGIGSRLGKNTFEKPTYPQPTTSSTESQLPTPPTETVENDMLLADIQSEGDVIPGGFKIVGDGIEISPFELATYVRETKTNSANSSLSEKTPSKYTFKLATDNAGGVTPEITIDNGTIRVSDALTIKNGGEYQYVRLDTLPSSDSSATSDAQLVVEKKYSDGTSDSDILTTIDFPNHHYGIPGSNATIYSSEKIADDEVRQIYPTLTNAADFIDAPLTAKIYKVPSAAFNGMKAIPDHILKMAGTDVVIPGFIENKNENLQNVANYFETARSVVKTITSNPQFSGEKSQQLQSLLQGYEKYLKDYTSNIYSGNNSHMSQDMVKAQLNNNPLFNMISVDRYLQGETEYSFGDVTKNPVDMVANLLTIWNFWGNEFNDKLITAGNDSQEMKTAQSETKALTTEVLTLLQTINPDVEAQKKFVNNLEAVKV